MGEFAASWLALREPFDHVARDSALLEHLDLPPGFRGLELAAGTGSGVRWLRQHFPDARWTLVDHDPELLRHVGEGEVYVHDLQQLEALDVDADLVTCQALLDLVSHDWLVRFADWLTARQVPLLAALTVDGRVAWTPPIEDDESVQSAFRAHQLTDRGFGDSPGPRAAHVLADLLGERGFRVETSRADWVIPPSSTEMLREMVQGTAHAAAEMLGENAVAAWREERLAAIDAARLQLLVGHLDLVAVPR